MSSLIFSFSLVNETEQSRKESSGLDSLVRRSFLARNRILGAISSATVIVEAGYRSGSLNVAARAAQIGRPIGAVPGPITSAASSGAHRLLREGIASLITDAGDVNALTRPPAAANGRAFEHDAGVARSARPPGRSL